MSFFPGGSKDIMRAQALLRRRQEEHEKLEEKKRKIEEDSRMRDIDHKFNAAGSAGVVEESSCAVGLVTLEDLKKKQVERTVAAVLPESKPKKPEEFIEVNRLSFFNESDDDEVVEEEECTSSKVGRYFGKNPDVDTSFLPDRQRDQDESNLREQLKHEWLVEQKRLKREPLLVLFSYWDGSGHPRSVQMSKGNTIQQFLTKAIDLLRQENNFIELKSASVDQLMFVKDDLILPHHLTFYDFCVMDARGKYGQRLFDTRVKVPRLTNDAIIDDDDVHSGKVLLRSWFDRNKHIFPACRWEAIDVEKQKRQQKL